ncbi:MAG TPA: hypothetical protein VK842_09000 [bacterium]|jgi:hypothetical protein|nr:hypothetical protein [bacterium]
MNLEMAALALLAATVLALPGSSRALPGDSNAGGAASDPVDGDGIRNSASSQDPAHLDQSAAQDPALGSPTAKPVRYNSLQRKLYRAFDGRLRIVGTRVDQAEHDKRLSQEQAAKLRQEIAALRLRYLYADGKRARLLHKAERDQLDVDIRAQELGSQQFGTPTP